MCSPYSFILRLITVQVECAKDITWTENIKCNIMSALCFIWEESKVLKKCFIFTCSKTFTLLAGARHGDLLEKQLIRGINPQLHCWLGISVKDNTSTLAAGSEDVYTSWPGRAIFTRSVSLQPTRSRRRAWIQIQLLPPYIYLNLPISTPWSPPPISTPKPTHLHPLIPPPPISTPKPTHLHPPDPPPPISTPKPTHLYPWSPHPPSPPLNLPISTPWSPPPISTPKPTHLHPLIPPPPISTPKPTHLYPWSPHPPSPPLNLPISTPDPPTPHLHP